MNKITKDYLNYLKYERNYTDQTIDSYKRDIEKFFKFLLEEDVLFDEVDATGGGETALAVGRMIREIGAKRQVFCITHLAPVAASGDHQLCVVKEVKNDQTHVHVESLNEEERVIELARMLGGQMEESRKYAATLLKKCREEKQ